MKNVDIAYKILCTHSEDEESFKEGEYYYVDKVGYIIGKDRGVPHYSGNYTDWYKGCHWTSFKFKLIEDYTICPMSEEAFLEDLINQINKNNEELAILTKNNENMINIIMNILEELNREEELD